MFATTELRNEHEGILVMLDVLEQLAQNLRQGKPVNHHHLEQILDFLRTFADKCHHGKEEDLLFPALEAAGLPRNGGPIAVMLDEHTRGRAAIRAMDEALTRLNAGEAAGQDFAEAALTYVYLLRDHISKENQVLFMMAERLLPETTHAQLAQEFERVEEERIGPGVHERYHALLNQFQETYLKKAA